MNDNEPNANAPGENENPPINNEGEANDENNGNGSAVRISPTSAGVIALGIYLIAVLLVSVYLLSVMIMAESPERTIGTLRQKCCGENNEACPPQSSTPPPIAANTANTNTASVTPTPAPTPTNVSPTPANAASTPTPANVTSTPVNANTANTSTARTNANASANTAANRTPTPNASPTPLTNEFPEVLIPPYVCVQHFNRLSADGFLFLVVLFAGMLGAAVRGVFSFVRHLGIGDFSFSWLWFYLLLPFSGAPVSLFLYFLIRGGFYGSPINKGLVLNLAAFAALGCLAGLFSENAMEKLKQVAEVLMTKVPRKSGNNPSSRNS